MFQYRKRYGLHAICAFSTKAEAEAVSIPQAVWIACNTVNDDYYKLKSRFQYRKRYGLHAIRKSRSRTAFSAVSIPQAVWIACNRSSLAITSSRSLVSIPQAVWIACNSVVGAPQKLGGLFQYRKRYGLHAILKRCFQTFHHICFNTASGMDCMQFMEVLFTTSLYKFQYRKRYGLHAIF